MTNPVLDAIRDRRSIRQYKGDPLTKEQWDVLMEAAVEAPSARNGQPWHFSVVTNRALIDEINEAAIDEFKKDPESKISARDLFHGAPAAIFISCDHKGRWAPHDCGLAVENIALAAHSIGLGTVILGLPEPAFKGPKGADFASRLKFPEGYSFEICLAVGTPAGTKEAHPVNEGLVDYIE
jgi:nitroreductase